MNSEPSTESLPALPDDVIYEIIEACDGLPTQRKETLFSLNLLATRFTAAARRVSWREITIDWRFARTTVVRTKLRTGPTWKAQVRLCTLLVPPYFYSPAWYMRALSQLPSIEQVRIFGREPVPRATHQALADVLQRQRSTLVSLSIDCYYHELYDLLASLGDAPKLCSLRVDNLPKRLPQQRVQFPSLTRLHVQEGFDAKAWRTIVSAAESTLVSIGLPISVSLLAVEPTEFPRLRELVMYGSPSPSAPTPDDIRLVNAFFLSCAALPFLATLRLHLRHHSSSSFPPNPSPSCAPSFLALVPPRIEHLDLTESTFSCADLEAFLYGATRPARLRTLRWNETTLEGGPGQSESEDEDEKEDWRERLREKLAEWGVEVTTLKP